jgi:hypothetical protein
VPQQHAASTTKSGSHYHLASLTCVSVQTVEPSPDPCCCTPGASPKAGPHVPRNAVLGQQLCTPAQCGTAAYTHTTGYAKTCERCCSNVHKVKARRCQHNQQLTLHASSIVLHRQTHNCCLIFRHDKAQQCSTPPGMYTPINTKL